MRGFLLAAAVTASVAMAAGPAPAGAVAAGGRVARGAQLWAARFGADGSDQAPALAVSPRGGQVFVAGAGYGGRATGVDYETVAYSAAGRRLWASRFSGPGRHEDDPYAVMVSQDGRTVFVTGGASGWGTGYDYGTVAYAAATGRQLWASHYAGPVDGGGGGAAIAVSPDGHAVFVTGTSGGGETSEYATVAYNAVTGRQLWASLYDSTKNGLNAAQSVAVSPDGTTVYVTGGGQDPAGYHDYATVAYNATTGKQRWASQYDGPAHGFGGALAVTVSPSGRTVFVTGDSSSRKTGYDYATVAYRAATGRQLWASRYHGPGKGFDAATAMAVSPHGTTVYVTGTAGTGYATVAYNAATGKQRWASRYDRGNQANSVKVSPDGTTVYVTGDGYEPSGYATVAYRAATGRQRWASRYHVAGNAGEAFAMGVSPAGTTVYVTGNVAGGTIDAYATIAYHG
jgi:DNA-binding beta-propeller fold protein YncE